MGEVPGPGSATGMSRLGSLGREKATPRGRGSYLFEDGVAVGMIEMGELPRYFS